MSEGTNRVHSTGGRDTQTARETQRESRREYILTFLYERVSVKVEMRGERAQEEWRGNRMRIE